MDPIGIIVLALRLVVPLSILRWPLAGMILSILADGADVMERRSCVQDSKNSFYMEISRICYF
jgi:hypothetical protein